MLDTQGISQYYKLHGNRSNPLVLLVGALGGVGAQWSNQLERFSAPRPATAGTQKR